jgi:hypothetical protein
MAIVGGNSVTYANGGAGGTGIVIFAF